HAKNTSKHRQTATGKRNLTPIGEILSTSTFGDAYQMFGNDLTTYARRNRSIPFCLTNEAIGYPMAAMCVRMSSDRSVLHFTPINAASCVLPRPASRVIHHWQ
ncbi:hypothetical protein DERP_012329, partial [Dermatophagoides pteronyssinus]